MRKSALVSISSCMLACAGAPPRGPAGPLDAQRVAGTPNAALASEPEGVPPMAPATSMAPAMAQSSATPTTATTAASPPIATAKPSRAEMLDIEAHLSVEVESVAAAATALRSLTRRFEGVVTNDQLNQNANTATAQLTIRVPSAQIDEFFDGLRTVGRLLSRQINARDIGKDFFDAELRLENLQTTMRRYQEVLKVAKGVDEILRIESELGRLRGEIEQTKGNLRWLSDRAARATVHINLVTASHEVVTDPLPPMPEAKLYPGLRLLQLTDFRGDEGNASYLGAGVSATFSRHFSLQLDGLRRTGDGPPTKGLDVMLLTLGGEMYSDFLGGGKRRFLNPYLGYTLGYARFLGKNEGVLGVTLGLELVKTKAITVGSERARSRLVLRRDGNPCGG